MNRACIRARNSSSWCLLWLLLLWLAAPTRGEGVREFVAIKYGDLTEVKSLLVMLVPDVKYAIDPGGKGLMLEGEPGAIQQVKELLAEFDRPANQVMLDSKTLALTPAAARTGGRPSDPRLTDYYLNAVARNPFIIQSNLALLISQNEAKVLETERLAVDPGQEAVLRLTGPAPLVWLGQQRPDSQ